MSENIDIPLTEPVRTRKSHASWQRQLMQDEGFISNILSDPYALKQAAAAGFKQAEIEQGFRLLEPVWESELRCEAKQAAKTKQHLIFKQSFENLEKEYKRHLHTARRIFNDEADRSIAITLKLDGKRPYSFEGKFRYITQFYSLALEDKDITNRLKARNIPTQLLEQMLRLSEDVLTNHQLIDRANNVSLRATEEKNIHLEKFYDWFRPFRALYLNAPEPPLIEEEPPKVK